VGTAEFSPRNKAASGRRTGRRKADDAEERRRQNWGEPSLQSSRDLEARKQYVRLYIEYTALHGPDDLYLDAIGYLKELEAAVCRRARTPSGVGCRRCGNRAKTGVDVAIDARCPFGREV
jgi:hypothetical protein